MRVDTERLKALLAKATQGEWVRHPNQKKWVLLPIPEDADPNNDANAELCVALHNDAPDLIAEVEAARVVVKAAKAALDKLDRYSTCTHLDMGGKHRYHIQVPYQTEIIEESKQALAAIAAYEEKHGT